MDQLGAWVLTYLIHSTVLLAVVLVAIRFLRNRPDIVSPLSKIALVGGIVTATVQLGAGLEPWGGIVAVDLENGASNARPEPVAKLVALDVPPVAEPSEQLDALDVPLVSEARELGPVLGLVSADRAAPRHAAPATGELGEDSSPQLTTAITGIFAASMLIGLVFGSVSLGHGLVALERRLRGREALTSGPLLASMRRLLERTGVRELIGLSVSDEVSVPMAFGWRHPEVVVPRRVVDSMTSAHQETLLAHELGHLVRRDPAWRILGLVITRVFFFQPLNRCAFAAMSQSAEYLCDDWAALATQRPLELATCLTEVAGWAVDERVGIVPAAVGTGTPRSLLGRRVHRLLEAPVVPSRRGPRFAVVAGASLMMGLAWMAPGVATGEVRERGSQTLVFDVKDPMALDEAPLLVVEDEPDARGSSRDAKRERAARRARRKARRQVRKAFRDARKEGRAAPDPDVLARIAERARVQVSPRDSVALEVVVPENGAPVVVVERDGVVARLDELSPEGREEVRQALREARRVRARALQQAREAQRAGQRARARAERDATRGARRAQAEALRALRERGVEVDLKGLEELEIEVDVEGLQEMGVDIDIDLEGLQEMDVDIDGEELRQEAERARAEALRELRKRGALDEKELRREAEHAHEEAMQAARSIRREQIEALRKKVEQGEVDPAALRALERWMERHGVEAPPAAPKPDGPKTGR